MTIEERAVMERREYFRKWRQEHKENVRRYNKNYWEKKAREAAEATAAALTEDQTATEPSSSGSDPEGQTATNGGELTDEQLREIVARKREQIKGCNL